MASHLRSPCSKKFINDIIPTMESIAPLKLADTAWDNVGLIAESPLPLNKRLILVTNDLTSGVLSEAVEKKASMIISYHAPWFKSSKNLRLDGPLANISYCISNGISVYSPHTALDAIIGGINDWISDAFGKIQESAPIVRSLHAGFENCGFGRIIELSEPISLNTAVKALKAHLKLEKLRHGNARDSCDLDQPSISKIAVCAGSGGSIFSGLKADLFVTGELGHHQVLELCDRQNAHVLLTEHSNSERGYLRDVFVPLLSEYLKRALDDPIEVIYSDADYSDPLSTV